MKKLFLLNVILFLSIFLNGQNSINDDAKARIGTYLKINPQILNVQVSSIEAKSIVDIIVYTYENFLVIPDLPLNNITDAKEKSEINQLIQRLENLTTNPPSWQEILTLQIEKKSTPPTPPVYVGDDKASQYYNTKSNNFNKKSSQVKANLIEMEISKSEPTPLPDKTKE
ncbi:MAG: hypothetical protein WAP17_04945 [Bacteroidales bacterium]|jgi:hypothetical protein